MTNATLMEKQDAEKSMRTGLSPSLAEAGSGLKALRRARRRFPAVGLLLSFAVPWAAAVRAEGVSQTDYTSWVTLTNSDDKPVFSFNPKEGDSVYWSDGAFPSSDKDYYVPEGKELMTVSSGKSSATFKGRHLAVAGRVLFRSTSGYEFSMGSPEGGILLPGGAIRFQCTSGTWKHRVAVEATADDPAELQLHATLAATSARGSLLVEACFDGGTDAALRFARSNEQEVLPVPDSTFSVLNNAAFTNYFGTVLVGKNVELAFDKTVTQPTIPGTLALEADGRLLSEAYSSQIVLGNLSIADGALMKWSFTTNGEANVVLVTNALTFAEGATATIQVADWRPHAGTQKYPILKLTGPAAESAVTAENFTCDFTSELWHGLPKSANPQIAIDETADGKVLSIEWPDEAEPFARFDSDGNLVLDASTAYGNALDDVADEGGSPLTVIKQGTGAVQLGTNSTFTGALDVREGTLYVGQSPWEYYRWVIKASFRGSEHDDNSRFRTVGLKSFGLFDANGEDRVYKQSDEGDWESAGHYYRSYSYETPIQPGHFRVTYYSGNAKTYRGFCAKDSTVSKGTNLFAHGSLLIEDFYSETLAKHPVETNVATWAVITMRMTTGAPVTSWDYVNTYESDYSYQEISNCTLEASYDCANWTQVGSVLNATRPTLDTWQGTGAAYEAGFTTHTGGLPVSTSWSTNAIAFAATKAAVAGGATLAARTGEAPVLGELAIDLEKGLGTIVNFAFAETGTLRITNAHGAKTFRIPADLSKSVGWANLRNWTLLVDGVDRTKRSEIAVAEDGISVRAPGCVLILK